MQRTNDQPPGAAPVSAATRTGTGRIPLGIFGWALGGLLLTAALAATPQSALESDPKGWVDILPDESFKGWTRLALPSDKPLDPASQWKVDKAARLLVCEGNKGHEWLRYDRELRNAIFHVEWRFVPIESGKGYNSGVYIRNSADGRVWHQAQTGGGSGGFIFGDTPVKGEVKRVNLRAQVKENRVRPAGEWNTFELRAEGNRITLSVNGAVTSEFTECEASKGHVGLEAEGYRIEFRNLKLKELP